MAMHKEFKDHADVAGVSQCSGLLRSSVEDTYTISSVSSMFQIGCGTNSKIPRAHLPRGILFGA